MKSMSNRKKTNSDPNIASCLVLGIKISAFPNLEHGLGPWSCISQETNLNSNLKNWPFLEELFQFEKRTKYSLGQWDAKPGK